MTVTDMIIAGAMKAGERQIHDFGKLTTRLQWALKNDRDGGPWTAGLGEILDQPTAAFVRLWLRAGVTRDADGVWSMDYFEELRRKGREWRAKRPASTAARSQ